MISTEKFLPGTRHRAAHLPLDTIFLHAGKKYVTITNPKYNVRNIWGKRPARNLSSGGVEDIANNTEIVIAKIKKETNAKKKQKASRYERGTGE